MLLHSCPKLQICLARLAGGFHVLLGAFQGAFRLSLFLGLRCDLLFKRLDFLALGSSQILVGLLVGFLFLQLFLQVLGEVIGHSLQDSHDGGARGFQGLPHGFLKEGSASTALHELHRLFDKIIQDHLVTVGHLAVCQCPATFQNLLQILSQLMHLWLLHQGCGIHRLHLTRSTGIQCLFSFGHTVNRGHQRGLVFLKGLHLLLADGLGSFQGGLVLVQLLGGRSEFRAQLFDLRSQLVDQRSQALHLLLCCLGSLQLLLAVLLAPAVQLLLHLLICLLIFLQLTGHRLQQRHHFGDGFRLMLQIQGGDRQVTDSHSCGQTQ
mmetsp:Transcript_50307/g.80346  ORF Transcript_50307/g.80346 Transcript_50307/m.80346 type:complete len:322 (-) Transcript_50307:76-1041(-)